jgi:hypothetical protein
MEPIWSSKGQIKRRLMPQTGDVLKMAPQLSAKTTFSMTTFRWRFDSTSNDFTDNDFTNNDNTYNTCTGDINNNAITLKWFYFLKILLKQCIKTYV